MSNSDFEKHVQDELDDLSIQPSDALWDRVEAELPEKRRRRWALLFLPLLLAGAIFFIINNDKSPGDLQQLDKSKPPLKDKQSMLPGSSANTNTKANTNTSKSIGTTPQAKPSFESIVPDDEKDNEGGEKYKQVVKSNTEAKEHPISNTKSKFSKNDDVILTDPGRFAADIRHAQPEADSGHDPVSVARSEEIKKETITNSSTTDTLTTNSVTDPKLNVVVSTSDADTSSLSSIAKADALLLIKNTDTTVTGKSKEKIKKPESKWVLGLVAGAGISNVKGGLFPNRELYVNASSSAPPPIPSSPATSQIKPDDPSASFAFNAGFYVENKLNSKLTFHTGIHYAYLSSRIEIGARVDSSGNFITNSGTAYADSYYRNGNSNKYINSFHLLSLPLMLQLRPINKWPFFAEGGLTTSFLINSNALQYSANRNAYFKSNESYNRILFGLQAGIGTQLKSVKVGYRFNYSLSSVFKDASPQFPVSSMIYIQVPIKKF